MESLLYRINRRRLLETINVSSSIGASENGGLSRLALSEEDKTMRDIFVEWLHQEKLDVRIDDFGNIYGRRKGKRNDGPTIAVGSHLDTQPCGGRYDGVLGVLAALEVIRVLNENNIETEFPIEIINFTNEEGARFGPPMLGSGGVTENFTKNFIYNIKDSNDITFKQALKSIGYMGEIENRLSNVKNFIELHIEQGSILEKNNTSIGIVEGIQGMSWLIVKVTGETNHAGPTPMENRKDALLATSKMIGRVNDLTKEFDGLKTTVGTLNVKPNITNVIPGEVEFIIDIRHPSNETRANAIESLKEQLSTIALMNDVEITITTDWTSDAVEFSQVVTESIREASEKWGYSSLNMYSGPGHDAKYISQVAESGMIFVPSCKGISHNEQELTVDDDIEKGANVLLTVINNLANGTN
ncbi:M20 family metallo-hydrolase [Virgibacillus necropolis]|uniref:Zn-dependent hydrolase n=1 Tax=Virgibacillus necropolis TaxID=163877 RepID=A0A221MF13_9BACI|nr:M20 family metallo-hydrolase [Virgibacillus necropolis]ASN06231.1 Zn-dependent hydrolase [Virgibacillus necropolis]